MHLERREDGQMAETTRADSCDGEIHVHTFDHSGCEERRSRLLRISGPEDVTRGYDLAYARVIDNWDADVRRWGRGRQAEAAG